MKLLAFILVFSFSSLTKAEVPGPRSDSGNKDTSVMGGGTPGKSGERILDKEEIQKQEAAKKIPIKEKKQKNMTDQNSDLDSM